MSSTPEQSGVSGAEGAKAEEVAQDPVGVGIVGLGFMGRTHARAFAAADAAGVPNRLIGVFDMAHARSGAEPDASDRHGNLSGARIVAGQAPEDRLREARAAESFAELLADPELELVSICTPTDTHVPLATTALEAGKHVLLEKPVALVSEDVERLLAAERASGRRCLPAMCMRFWPAWSWLLDVCNDETFGPVKSATFRRVGPPPDWSQSFYANETRSGGALFDLHIHDVDIVCALFGEPNEVSTTGTTQHLTTLYHFDGGPRHVTAEGGWAHTRGAPFRMQFTVAFENATADFELGRDPELWLKSLESPEPHTIRVRGGDGYEHQARHALDVVRGRRTPEVTLADALSVTRILEREQAQLQRRG